MASGFEVETAFIVGFPLFQIEMQPAKVKTHRWKEGREFDSQRVTVQIFSWIFREGPKAFI